MKPQLNIYDIEEKFLEPYAAKHEEHDVADGLSWEHAGSHSLYVFVCEGKHEARFANHKRTRTSLYPNHRSLISTELDTDGFALFERDEVIAHLNWLAKAEGIPLFSTS